MSEYLIYCHTSPTGKKYIGQTNNYNRRCSEHKTSKGCPAFHNAIIKYGWDNFNHEILDDGLSLEEANILEEFYISKYNSLAPNGYNLQTGGNNSRPSPLVIQKDQHGSKNHMAKVYEIISPDNERVVVNGVLKKYCKDRNLSYDLMLRVSNPNYKASHHRGYKCRELINE
jgi:group I intron endonuclease